MGHSPGFSSLLNENDGDSTWLRAKAEAPVTKTERAMLNNVQFLTHPTVPLLMKMTIQCQLPGTMMST
jgi:hypothetical protein